jgi:hypothetical protein
MHCTNFYSASYGMAIYFSLFCQYVEVHCLSTYLYVIYMYIYKTRRKRHFIMMNISVLQKDTPIINMYVTNINFVDICYVIYNRWESIVYIYLYYIYVYWWVKFASIFSKFGVYIHGEYLCGMCLFWGYHCQALLSAFWYHN